MRSPAEMLDLSPLPVASRREIRDFYEFLLARRGQAIKKSAPLKLPAAFDTPIKVEAYLKISREEFYRDI